MHRWMALCAVLWGLAAASMAGVHSAWQLAVLRVVLGFAEGGLAPGIVLYLSQFATERERATTFALPMLAVPISIVVGGPISGWLMGLQLLPDWSGWRFMYVAEALPAILLGMFAWLYFPDRPDQARWLTDAERGYLSEHAANRPHNEVRNDWTVLRQPLVWMSCLLWFCLLSGAYGIMFWLPQMLKQLTGLPPLQVGIVNALPWFGLALGIYFNSAHSDRTGERFLHVALPALVAAVALVSAYAVGASYAGLALLFVAGTALGAAQGAFWSVPTSLLTSSTLAVAAVAINICGSAGGLVMPHLVGFVLQRSGSFAGPTLLVAGILLLAALLVTLIRLPYFATAARRAP
jgi:MFS family permease